MHMLMQFAFFIGTKCMDKHSVSKERQQH